MAGLTAADVPKLKLKWAFGFPGELSADAQPTIAGGRVFVGTQSGKVYALSAATGCVHWFVQAEAAVRAAVTHRAASTAGEPLRGVHRRPSRRMSTRSTRPRAR